MESSPSWRSYRQGSNNLFSEDADGSGSRDNLSTSPGSTSAHSLSAVKISSGQTDRTSSSTHVTTPGPPRKRKMAASGGSRGVANLSAEQLAKKRANDREAQRAIRERTKATIEGLERRIQELEAQKPYQDLLKIRSERDLALQECDRLQTVLNSIADLAKKNTAMSCNGSASGHAPATIVPHVDMSSSSTHLQSPMSAAYSSPSDPSPFVQQTSPGIALPENRDKTTGSPSMACVLPDRLSSSHISSATSERLGVNFLLDRSRSGNSATETNAMSFAAWPVKILSWSALPSNSDSTCPLDTILEDFVRTQRARLASGMPKLDVLGPEIPYYARQDDTKSQQHQYGSQPIIDLLVDILSKFPDISDAPEIAGVLYVMFLLVRWCICPCVSCYEKLPDWLRPTADQVEKPHPIWLDYLPWPSMRDSLIATFSSGHPIELEAFFVPYTTTLSLNWPYPVELLFEHSRNQPTSLGPMLPLSLVGEAHVRDLRNWSLGSRFQKTFPSLVKGETRIKDK